MATIAPYGVYQAFDDNGDPLAGGFLYTYEAGTSTPKATYMDSSGAMISQNTNPVELDASGMANVWLGDGGYKFILKDADLNTIFTVDNIGGTNDTAFGGEVNEISTNTNITSVYANSANLVTGTTTLSLIPASESGEGFYISVKNTGVGTVTIDPDAGEFIDGVSTKVINPNESALIICDGTAWHSFFFQTVSSSSNNTFTGNNSFSGKILYPDKSELTIASGVITVTGVNHTVDTEGDAATDNLDTINGGADGQILTLRTENDARDVVLTEAGNISIGGPNTITLGNTDSKIDLQYDGAKSKWLVTSYPAGVENGNIPQLTTTNGTTLLSSLLGGVPTGAVFWFGASTAPSGYLECSGAAISRTTYSALFSIVGTTFGAGDGSTTFNLPDLRGEFIRGWDNGRGTDPARAFGSLQASTSLANGRGTGNLNYKNTDGTDGTQAGFLIGTAASTTETFYKFRPTNIALLPCIKI